MSDQDGFIKLRKACPCGCPTGRVRRTGGQDVVRCADCDKYLYNAPREELGLPKEPRKPMLLDSKFAGQCRDCGKPHTVGDQISWTPGTKGVQCVRCSVGKGAA